MKLERINPEHYTTTITPSVIVDKTTELQEMQETQELSRPLDVWPEDISPADLVDVYLQMAEPSRDIVIATARKLVELSFARVRQLYLVTRDAEFSRDSLLSANMDDEQVQAGVSNFSELITNIVNKSGYDAEGFDWSDTLDIEDVTNDTYKLFKLILGNGRFSNCPPR